MTETPEKNNRKTPAHTISTSGKILWICVMLCILTGICLYHGIQSRWGVAWLENQINTRIPGTISISDLRLRLFTGHLRLKDIRLMNEADESLISVKSLDVRIKWHHLLTRMAITIDYLYLDRPEIDVAMDAQGGVNILQALVAEKNDTPEPVPAPKKRIFPFNIVLNDLAMDQGRYTMAIPHQKLYTRIDHIKIRGSGNLQNKAAAFQLSFAQSSWESQSMYRTDIDRGDVRVKFDDTGLNDLSISIEGPTMELVVTGTVRDLGPDPFCDLEIALDRLDMASLLNDLYQAPSLSGKVSGHIAAKGQISDPDIRLSLNAVSPGFQTWGVERLTLEAAMHHRDVDIIDLKGRSGAGIFTAKGRVSLARMFPKGLISSPVITDNFSTQLHLFCQNLSMEDISQAPGPFSFRAGGDGDFSLTGLDVDSLAAGLDLSLSLDQIRAEKVTVPSPLAVHLKAGVKNGTTTVDRLHISQPGLDLTTQGTLGLKTMQPLMRVNLSLAQHGDMAPLPLPDLEGDVALNLTLGGAFDRLHVKGALSGTGLRYGDVNLGDVALTAVLAPDGRLSLEKLSLSNGDGRITGRGHMDLFTPGYGVNRSGMLSADLTVTRCRPESFYHLSPVHGRLEGAIALSGSMAAPVGDITVSGTQLTYGENRIGDMTVSAGYNDGEAAVHRLFLTNNDSSITLSGRARFLDTATLTLRENPEFMLRIDESPLFLEDFKKDMHGKVVVSGSLEGSVKNPKGSVTIRGEALDLAVQKVENLTLEAELKDRILDLTNFTIHLDGDHPIVAAGKLSLNSGYPFEMKVHTSGLPLFVIDPLSHTDLSGGLGLTISGKGSIQSPELTGTVAIEQLMIDKTPLADIRADLGLKDNLLKVAGASGPVSIHGEAAINTHLFSLNAAFDNTDLTPYLSLFKGEDLSLRLTGNLTAGGVWDDPKRLSARFNFTDLDAGYGDKFRVTTTCLSGTLDKEKLQLARCRFNLPDKGWLILGGNGDLKGAIDVSAEGEVPLALASLFIEEISDIKGRITLRSHVWGTLQSPAIQTTMGVDHGEFVINDLAQKAHDINGRILISTETLQIDTLTGYLDSGRFALDGSIELKGFSPAYMKTRVTAHALPFNLPDTMSAVLNTDLTIEGTPDDTLASGNITLVEGTYYKDHKLNLIQGLTRKTREVKVPPKKIDTMFLKNLKLDIYIGQSHPFIVDNNLTRMGVLTELRVGGMLENPVLRGRMTIDEGVIYYFKKNFIVDQGIIDFINPYQTEPTLDLIARTEVRGWKIFLNISGPPDNLVCVPSSNPAENDEDILSLLVTGKTVRELRNNENSQARTPEQMLAELVASKFDKDIKRKTGLDIFEVESGNDGSSSDRLSLTVGKELSRRLILKYKVSNTDQGINQTTMAEYKFLEHILLTGFQDSIGDYGGEMHLRLEFR